MLKNILYLFFLSSLGHKDHGHMAEKGSDKYRYILAHRGD